MKTVEYEVVVYEPLVNGVPVSLCAFYGFKVLTGGYFPARSLSGTITIIRIALICGRLRKFHLLVHMSTPVSVTIICHLLHRVYYNHQRKRWEYSNSHLFCPFSTIA